jgi:CBS domain-containing protein/ribosome-associated translation inhibitor RaiA
MDDAFVDLRVKDVMERKVVKADASDQLHEWLSDPHLHSIPVFDRGKLAGMIDYRRLMKSRMNVAGALMKTFAAMPPVLGPDELLIDALPKLLESDFRAAPVMTKGRLAGILGLHDIACAVAMHREFSPMRASAIMTTDFASIKPGEDLGKALDIMIKRNISRLPVIEGDSVVGVLAFRDIVSRIWHPQKREGATGLGPTALKAVGYESESVTRIPVKGLMSFPPVTVPKNATLDEICAKTSRFEVSDVIVAEQGRPLGIITLRDICRAALELPRADRTIAFTFSGISLPSDDQEYVRHDVEALYRKTLHPIEAVDFHVKKHDTAGRAKYSVNAKVRTDYGFFTASATAWNALKAFEDCTKELERIIGDRKERARDKERSIRRRFKTYESR